MALAEFEEWLCGVLESAGADGEVYGGYISGTLAAMSGSPSEETEEAIRDILSASLEDEVVCREVSKKIVTEWVTRETERLAAKAQEKEDREKEKACFPDSSGDRREKRDPLSLIGSLSRSDKQKLVAEYGDLSDDEADLGDLEDDPGGGGASRLGHTHSRAPTMAGVFENMNAKLVTHAEREKREKEKAAHEVKLDRDRKNREAQKQKALDRKEKEKKRTQKHERRR